MASKFFSERNLRFLLYEVFDVATITQYDYYKEYDGHMLDMVLKAAKELGEGLLWPVFQEMDKIPPELVEDQIKVHPSVRKLLEECGAGGWIGDDIPFEWGGQQLPQMITIVKGLRNSPSGVEANFYNGKFFAFRYYFEYELPKIEGLATRLMNSDGLTVEITPDLFSD